MGILATSHARTWTSADGEKHFAGIYLHSDASSLTVSMSGKEATFKLDLVSKEDREWVKTEEKRLADAEKKDTPEKPTLADQYIGKKLMGKTSSIRVDKFHPTNTNKVPEYYFLYYSASW